MGIHKIASQAVSASSSPINVLNFAKSLLRLFPRSVYDHGSSHNGKRPKQIGLAISGGVDSMALALLCSQLKDIKPSTLFNHDVHEDLQQLQQCDFKAFIVNHGAREGSLDEAHAVAEVLHKRNISTEVLLINWPSNPSKQPNFESLARRYRFQTLGKACYRHNINALLLAHHQDDQAETLLMRLINGHGTLGLTGIKPVASIPECRGLYGVCESGDVHHPVLSNEQSSKGRAPEESQLAMATGGVKIIRPLLGFKKDELRATCEEARMEWFEDPTNQDPTLTMRNAVRKLYRSHQMPKALTKPSLLASSERVREKVAAQAEVVAKLLQECEISRFESRSGIVQLRFPDVSRLIEGKWDVKELRSIAALLLRRIIMLITPNEHVELNTLHKISSSVFPELYPDASKRHAHPTKQTVAGIQLTPVPSNSATTHSSNMKQEWLLSRQPFTRTEAHEALHTFSPHSSASEWTLVDNRYWLRLKSASSISTPTQVNALNPDMLGRFLKELDARKRKALKEMLGTLAPSNVRWTLLALVVEGRCVGIPSLSVYVEGWEGSVEILYRKADMDGMKIGQTSVKDDV